MSNDSDGKNETEPKDGSGLEGGHVASEDEKPPADAAGRDEAAQEPGSGDEGSPEGPAAADDEDKSAKPAPEDNRAAGTVGQESNVAKGHTRPKPKAGRARGVGVAKKKGARPAGGPGQKLGGSLAKKASPASSIWIYAVLIAVVLAGVLGLAYVFLRHKPGAGKGQSPQPAWNEGDTVDVSITVVTTDYKDLACASEQMLKDLHCGFADKTKPHPKGSDARADANVLQPFTTTDRIQFLAAGMWLTPEMTAKLAAENWSSPSPRLTVSCKYKVAGKMKEANIRWKPEADWLPNPARDWFAGSLSDCTLRPVAKKPSLPAAPPAAPAKSN